jgi:molecular chaperone GrpE (heat shock protein)
MTYVREQSSTELAVHMRSLQKMPGWHDPLADRLWQEVEALKAEVAGLRTGYEAYERVNAELKAEVEGLRKDAERYRWLRRAGNTKAIALVAEHCLDALDEAIDAALGQGEQP